ncbi:MAG: hypothetical protein ACP5M4_09260 [Acidobacteriaceae bacterium]
MTRKEVLALLVLHARNNGFLFRRWYKSKMHTPWQDFETSIDTISRDHRYYALLFSHDFAQCFWKHGSQITFVVPTVEYKRPSKNGKIITVRRKAFTRRTTKPDAWIYHLREMAASEDPLRYIRRFLVTREEIEFWNKPAARGAGNVTQPSTPGQNIQLAAAAEDPDPTDPNI